MQERLGLAVERYDAGETTSELNVISSGLHEVRGIFDLMPLDGDDAAENIAARLAAVPTALKQYQQTAARGRRAPATSRPGTRCSRSPSSATSGPTRTATTSTPVSSSASIAAGPVSGCAARQARPPAPTPLGPRPS